MYNNSVGLLQNLFVMNMVNNAILIGIAQKIGIKQEEIDKLIKIGNTSAIEALKEFNKEKENKENGK